MSASAEPTTIIGAGPYGLAAAAYLRAAGLETRVFGKAMEFWNQNMPAGMCLRSSWDASHIADPHRNLTLDDLEAVRGARFSRPLPLGDFVDYGRWFQQQAAPNLDERRVEVVDRVPQGFRLRVEGGEEILTPRVIVAAGIGPFAYRPSVFAPLPPDVAPHSSVVRDVDRFAGQRVAVIGGGQSALETAVLLGEAGAEVEVLMRRPIIRWLHRTDWIHTHLGPIRSLLYPPTDVGPPILNQLVARPDLFRQVPLRLQPILAYRAIRPAVSDWLQPRLGGVQVTTGRTAVATQPHARGAALRLDDGTMRQVDRVVVATGYRINIARYPFLSRDLLTAIQQRDGYPILGRGLESSVPNLYFLGAPAAASFGPLMRFVSGTRYAASHLVQRVVGAPRLRVQESANLPTTGQLATGM